MRKSGRPPPTSCRSAVDPISLRHPATMRRIARDGGKAAPGSDDGSRPSLVRHPILLLHLLEDAAQGVIDQLFVGFSEPDTLQLPVDVVA
jgi:hypothetical protein